MEIVTKKVKHTPDMSNLYDPRRYEYEITKEIKKLILSKFSNVNKKNSEGITPISYLFDLKRVTRALIKDLRKECYKFKTAKLNEIVVRDKVRVIYNHPLMDKIVIAVLSNLMHEIFCEYLSHSSYAYQKGRGCLDAVQDLSNYVNKHLQKPGIYVVMLDVQSYTDEVYVGENSNLWVLLAELFAKKGITPSPYIMSLIRFIIRPEYYNSDGFMMSNLYGIPTGQAITAILYNYYIYKLDHAVTALPDVMYVRYSDDILIAHHDYSVIKKAQEIITKELLSQRLRSNKKKTESYFFTPSSKESDKEGFVHTNVLNYLGYRITAKGIFSLSSARQTRFLKSFQLQISNTFNLLKKRTPRVLRVLIQSINKSIEDAVISIPDIRALVLQTTDYAQLKHMDYLIALYIAEGYTGLKGPRAFRRLSYRLLRSRYHLKSLAQLSIRSKS
jgi:retron-type reverse transcriptase